MYLNETTGNQNEDEIIQAVKRKNKNFSERSSENLQISGNERAHF